MSELVTAVEEKGVLTITLRRPQKRNALSRALIAELAASFTLWKEREDLAVAVLTGEGDKAFASGGDLDELATLRDEAETIFFARETRASLDTIRRFPVPVVAALNGDALGGGAELAMACDLRVAAHHARIGFLQGRLNIATAWGGGTDLLRHLGSARALELGLVDAVAPNSQGFRDFVAAFASHLASRKPQVMRAFKSLAIAHRFGASNAEMAEVETHAFARTWVHADHWAAAQAITSRTPPAR